MSLPGFTPQQGLDLYYLIRNIQWRYRLDQAEAEAIARIARLLGEMREELAGRISLYAQKTYTRARLETLLAEVEVLLTAAQAQTANVVAETSGIVGALSLQEQHSIVSVGGLAKNVKALDVGSSSLGALFLTTPLGGRSLQGWVARAFEGGQQHIVDAIQKGLFQGEAYPKIIRRVLREAEHLTTREAITLTRTYVQSASVSAQEAVYGANKNIVGWVEWSAIMEPGYKQTGRGTCITCAALDGLRWRIDDKERPECPKHPRCRCHLLPVVDWQRLGITENTLDETVRPYTIRPNQNIDAGGRREILEGGMAEGSWGKWAGTRDSGFKVNAIGPQRYGIWERSGLSFEAFMHRLVNKKTGEMYTVQELEGMLL